MYIIYIYIYIHIYNPIYNIHYPLYTTTNYNYIFTKNISISTSAWTIFETGLKLGDRASFLIASCLTDCQAG